jgi:hypothetical protein
MRGKLDQTAAGMAQIVELLTPPPRRPVVLGVCAVAGNAWDVAAVGLYTRFRAGEVSAEDMAAELPKVWRYRSDRDPLDSDAAWRAMVEHAGYFTWASGQHDGRQAPRPRRARRLFRGAAPSRRFGMSWTANPDIGEYFARFRQPPDVNDGQVWVGVFAPSRRLAYLDDEREYLVDAAGLDVRPWMSDNTSLLSRLLARARRHRT